MINHLSAPMGRDSEERHLQGDLFTGKWEAKAPKRGNGSHVRLKRLDGEKPAVPGMASYTGEGPAGTYCKDCAYFGEIAVQVTPNAVEKNPAGCAIYTQHMGHAAPTRRRDISLCASCRFFENADEPMRRIIVDQAGEIHRVEKIPENLRRWQAPKQDAAE